MNTRRMGDLLRRLPAHRLAALAGMRAAAAARRRPHETMRHYYYLEKIIYEAFELTEREAQVAFCILRGGTYHQIARWLFIAERTVLFHAGNIYQKTGTCNRREFVRLIHRRLGSWCLRR